MHLIGTRSKIKFGLIGAITLFGMYAFGFISLLGSAFAFDELMLLMKGGFNSGSHFDLIYITGYGGLLGLLALALCWLSIMWQVIANSCPRVLIALLVLGLVSASANIIWIFQFGADLIRVALLFSLVTFMLLAVAYIFDLLTIKGSRALRAVCFGR